MKKYTDKEIFDIITEYVELSDDTRNYKKSNRLFDKLSKIKIDLSNNEAERALYIMNSLLDFANLAQAFYGALWALNCNYKREKALEIISKMSGDNNFRATRFTACITLDMINGKFGGWKRNEKYPDLSKYEFH